MGALYCFDCSTDLQVIGEAWPGLCADCYERRCNRMRPRLLEPIRAALLQTNNTKSRKRKRGVSEEDFTTLVDLPLDILKQEGFRRTLDFA